MKISYIRPKGSISIHQRLLNEIYFTKNKQVIRCLTAGITLLLSCGYAFAEEVSKETKKPASDPLKELGFGAIDYVQFGLTIIAIVMALFETGKSLLEGDPKRIPSIFAKYGIGVICIYTIPWAYLKIRDSFKGWRLVE